VQRRQAPNGLEAAPAALIILMNPHPLESLFKPRSIALVGATEKAMWTGAILRNFSAYQFDGELYAVNRQGVDVLGVKGYPSCVAIGRPIDAAYIIVPVTAIRDAMADVIAAGIKTAVILTSGFAEVGAEGVALQSEIVAMARAAGVRFLGPNSLGFANIADRKPLTAIPPQLPLRDGSVGLISQSGATTSELMDIARRLDIGLSFAAATGNEAMIGMADLVDFLVQHPPTRVIAVYCETIRDTVAFSSAALKAHAAGKPIVMIKVGSSALSASVAAAHTGSLVGDNRVFEAACARLNIIRVRTVEELIITAGFLNVTGELPIPGVAIISVSGGACAMSTDIAEPLGVDFPAFAPDTCAALREVLPAYGATLNPLDATGAVMADPGLFERTIRIVAADPAIGCIFAIYPLPDTEAQTVGAPQLKGIGTGLNAIAKPGFLLTQSIQPVNAFGRLAMEAAGIRHTLTGLEAGLRAVAGAVRWSTRRRSGSAARIGSSITGDGNANGSGNANGETYGGPRPLTERATLEFLSAFGVPVVPAILAGSKQDAAAAVDTIGGRVVLKVASADIKHKSDIGGVKLNITGGDAAAAAYEAIITSVKRAKPDATIDGIIVSPMREHGVELFAGVARDPQWGMVIAVALGGVWVEILDDSALSLLPVTSGEVERMLRSLRGAALLDGHRGTRPVNIRAAADAIANIGNAALALGPQLAALEVNPLLAYEGKIEALDALAIWSDSKA
jgi:acetate---CoA ligase (ADP-forming)